MNERAAEALTTIALAKDSKNGFREAHVFAQEDLDAIDAALAAERPLLVRGEPGVGKTQLALAAAIKLKRAFCPTVVDSRTEVRDLRWTEDLVARLADAQLVAALDAAEAALQRGKLGIEHYVEPGPLWWAFDWSDAAGQAKAAKVSEPAQPHEDCNPKNGVVVLIDEIDKADPDLPNGLLEALGSRQFTPRGRNAPVRAKVWPLVIVTTNEDRALPDAFIRRCVVHDIHLPEDDTELQSFLVGRGRAHFPEAPPAVLEKAAEMTVKDRNAAAARRLTPLPGQAEFIDLIRAVLGKAKDADAAIDAMERLAPYFLRKHSDLRR